MKVILDQVQKFSKRNPDGTIDQRKRECQIFRFDWIYVYYNLIKIPAIEECCVACYCYKSIV